MSVGAFENIGGVEVVTLVGASPDETPSIRQARIADFSQSNQEALERNDAGVVILATRHRCMRAKAIQVWDIESFVSRRKNLNAEGEPGSWPTMARHPSAHSIGLEGEAARLAAHRPDARFSRDGSLGRAMQVAELDYIVQPCSADGDCLTM